VKAIREMTEAELAALVQDHLATRGIRVVLSGGTCVTIYARGAYVSGDLDLVLETYARPQRVSAALAELGFERRGRVFKHPDSSLWLDIRSAPLAVGSEPVREIRELRFSTGVLRIISPTDCVKDRLAAYYYHNDRQCLEQACLVVASSEVDLAEVERWSIHEGQEAGFAPVKQRLLQAAHGRPKGAEQNHKGPTREAEG
jgi:hypothetical protein